MKIKKQAIKQLKHNTRWHALQLFNQVEYEGEYSNVLVDRFLSQTTLPEREQALLVQLVYGTIQRKRTIDFQLEPFITSKKMDQWVHSLLRLSIYQILYLDRIPNHAVINEAVKIAKTNGHQALGNFVNAVLRNFTRGQRRDMTMIEPLSERLSVMYSIDSWIVDVLLSQMTEDNVERLLASLLKKPVVSARINTDLRERATLMMQLETEGFQVETSPLSPYGIRCLKGNVVHSQLFADGKLTIQDESSMLVAPLGKLKGHEQVLDACAAPGGKATHIASLLTSGHLTALDISASKLNKVAHHLERMHLTERVTLEVADARKFVSKNQALYDMIYLDAPCSGLGLMRRKPEIKYDKSLQDVISLSAIQVDLLDHVATLLQPNGTLIYSTCTLAPQENEQQVANFLKRHPEFVVDPVTQADTIPQECITPEGYVKVLPHQFHTDGFFICRLVKKAI